MPDSEWPWIDPEDWRWLDQSSRGTELRAAHADYAAALRAALQPWDERVDMLRAEVTLAQERLANTERDLAGFEAERDAAPARLADAEARVKAALGEFPEMPAPPQEGPPMSPGGDAEPATDATPLMG